MIFEPFEPYLAREVRVKFATEAWERHAAAALRHQVFCREQRIFPEHDRDALDEVALVLVAVTSLGVATDEVVGTVRIHAAEPGVWWGSRLAVARPWRRTAELGTALIRLAVGSAHARGCWRFLAHVQAQNAMLFQRLHWETLGHVTLHGRLHHHMQADLAFYPPIQAPETGFLALPKAA